MEDGLRRAVAGPRRTVERSESASNGCRPDRSDSPRIACCINYEGRGTMSFLGSGDREMMDVSPNLEFGLRLVTVAAVILTAWIGIHGLRHEYRTEDGQLTKAGRRARGLMGGLALLSVASELTRFVVDSEKERRSAAEATTRFEAQMSRLDDVTDTLSGISSSSFEVAGGLRESLGKQNNLLRLTDQNLRLSREVGAQGRQNTEDVLRRIFEDSNRVQPERLTLAVENACARSGPGPLTNPLVGDTVVARVRVRGRSPRRVEHVAQFSAFERQTHDGSLVGQVSGSGGFATTNVFTGFSGEISGLELIEDWRGAVISAEIITIRRSMTVDEAINQLNGTPGRDNAQRCRATMRFFLNSRLVATAEEPELFFDPNAPRFVHRFENVRVQDHQIPRFQPYAR